MYILFFSFAFLGLVILVLFRVYISEACHVFVDQPLLVLGALFFIKLIRNFRMRLFFADVALYLFYWYIQTTRRMHRDRSIIHSSLWDFCSEHWHNFHEFLLSYPENTIKLAYGLYIAFAIHDLREKKRVDKVFLFLFYMLTVGVYWRMDQVKDVQAKQDLVNPHNLYMTLPPCVRLWKDVKEVYGICSGFGYVCKVTSDPYKRWVENQCEEKCQFTGGDELPWTKRQCKIQSSK